MVRPVRDDEKFLTRGSLLGVRGRDIIERNCRERDRQLLHARSGSGEMKLFSPFLCLVQTFPILVEMDDRCSSTLQLESTVSRNGGLASDHSGVTRQEH